MSTQRINKILTLNEEIHKSALNQFQEIFNEAKTTMVCFKFIDLLDPTLESLKVRPEPLLFPLCEIYYLESLGILSSYVIYVTGYNVDILDKYIRIRRPSMIHQNTFNNVKMIHQDKYINVIHSDDGACLISINGLKWIIKPDMIRRSEKNEREEDVSVKT